ncbi:hypothetical protein Tco_1237642 [Tanacetum coccineum]
MDNPNITLEEYIKFQEEKALSRGETFNWQTATYGKREYCDDEYDRFKNFEAEFPAIVLGNTNAISSQTTRRITMEKCEAKKEDPEIKFPAIVLDDTSTSDIVLSYEPTVSHLNEREIDFRISFGESDDDDYTNELPAIVYNDALTSKSDFLTEHIISPQHIDEFNNKTSLPECDEKEQNILYFNDLLPFNVIYPDDLKSDTDNDNDKIDIEQPSGDMSVIPSPNDLAENGINLMVYSEKSHVLNSHGQSKALFNTHFAQTLKMENHPEQTIRGVSSF